MSSLYKARDLQAGAVAAGHRVTADAAARVLNQGGNAFQAVLTALIAACLAEPVFASPGGGGFMTARHRNGTTDVLDFFVDLPSHKQTDRQRATVLSHWHRDQRSAGHGSRTGSACGAWRQG